MLEQTDGTMKTIAQKDPDTSDGFTLSVRSFSPSECPGLCQHRTGHSPGKKELTDRVKPSEVAGSLYAMVFMAPFVCSSIDFC